MSIKSIIKIVIIAVLAMLFSGRALAYDSPTYTVSANPQTLSQGEQTVITVLIFNTTDVDIMPTVCFINGIKIEVYSGFLMPGQSTTVTLPITASFSGNQSQEVRASLIYHEDGDYDTCLPFEYTTLYNDGGLPPIDVITPAPEWSIITPTPEFSVITPAPTPWQPVVITPQPTAQPLPQMTDIQADNPQPTPTPIPQNDNEQEIIHNAAIDETEQAVVLSAESTPQPTNAYIEMKITKNRSIANDEDSPTQLIYIMDSFTIFCIALLFVFGLLYLVLLIKVKRNRK